MKTLVLVIAFCGCATLQDYVKQPGDGQTPSLPVKPKAPTVTTAGVTLVQAPKNSQLTGYLCERVAPSYLCRVLAPRVDIGDIRFVFDVELDVKNPNAIPLPMVEALAAFTVFSDVTGQQNLGSVCLSMCEDPASCPQNTADACTSDEPMIRSTRDFVGAAAGFLFAVATGQASVDNLRLRTIPANGTTRVVFRLQLDAGAAMQVIERVAGDAIASIRSGRMPRFEIPFQVEGSIWVRVHGFAKFGASFPAHRDTWSLAD